MEATKRNLEERAYNFLVEFPSTRLHWITSPSSPTMVKCQIYSPKIVACIENVIWGGATFDFLGQETRIKAHNADVISSYPLYFPPYRNTLKYQCPICDQNDTSGNLICA